MIKISRISSPLKDKIKNIDTCSQLDGDGVFEGKYSTSGTIVLKNFYLFLIQMIFLKVSYYNKSFP